MTTEPEIIEEMFVQVANSVSAADSELTLNGVSGSTLYFSDRPERVVGHLPTEQFVKQWGDGNNSFADDPPNAVVSFATTGADTPEEAVVVLRDPKCVGDSITYAIDLLEGTLPETGSQCALFIDPIGRPLSPGSVMGMRRREGRRDRRRG